MMLEILLSCMYQNNADIVCRTNITTDALIINQTDFNRNDVIQNGKQTIRLYNTVERGLSKSRNMALRHASGDICLICDDDEVLRDGYDTIIFQAFKKLPDAAVIAFDVENKSTRLKPNIQRVGRLRALKLASYQLAIKNEQIMRANIGFDEYMGAGSGNGSGEENKFLWDCIRHKLNVYYVPETIGQVCHGPSTWFFGYDRKFFYQRGASTRHMMGLIPSIFYGLYYLTAKHSMYGETLGFLSAARALFRGIYENPIQRQIKECQERRI
jgi:glycosyltransferase involved in cell wall biosynthesis